MAVHERGGGQDEEGEKIEEVVDCSEIDKLRTSSIQTKLRPGVVFQGRKQLQMEDHEPAWSLAP